MTIPEINSFSDLGHEVAKEVTGIKTNYILPAIYCLRASARSLRQGRISLSAGYALTCGMYTMVAVSSLFIPPDVKLMGKIQKFAQGRG